MRIGIQFVFAAQGLQGLQGLLAAHGLHGLAVAAQGLQGLALAAQGLHGLAVAAQGLQGLAFAAQGLHGLTSFAAQGLQGLHGFCVAATAVAFNATVVMPAMRTVRTALAMGLGFGFMHLAPRSLLVDGGAGLGRDSSDTF